jgi:hypothetical protein
MNIYNNKVPGAGRGIDRERYPAHILVTVVTVTMVTVLTAAQGYLTNVNVAAGEVILPV